MSAAVDRMVRLPAWSEGGGPRLLARRILAEEAAAPIGLLLTMALVLLYSPSAWYVRTPVVTLALVALLWRGALGRPLFWTVLAAVLAAGVYLQRFTIDNHQYLMAYWCAAIALSLGAADPRPVLRRNARVLVGLAFGFAAVWKLASPEFVSGAFLEYEMLADPRFAGFTQLMAGLSREALAANRAAIEGLHGMAVSETVRALTTTPAVSSIAHAMTWYTLVVESWIALAFLLPGGWFSRTRDLPLLAFLFTTYSVANVPGFAYLLIAMGFVQCERRHWWIPCGYLAAVFVMQVFLLPLGHIAAVLGFEGAP